MAERVTCNFIGVRCAYINARVFFEFVNAGILCKSKLLGGYKVSDVKLHPEQTSP